MLYSYGSMNSIKAVFFDADDTVFTVYPSVAHHYNQILSQHGIAVPEKDLSGVIKKNWKAHQVQYENREHGYATSVERDKALWIQYAQGILNEVSPQPHPKDLPSRIYETFSNGGTRKILDGFIDTAVFLRSRGIFTGLFTNNDMRTHSVVLDLGIAHLFDVVLTAGEVGYKKPALEAFNSLLLHSKTLPHESLFVGDSFENDCLGAHNAGWKAVLLDPESRPTLRNHPDTIESIQTLKELISIVTSERR